jgi:16S rRNA (cytosine1402-N4)-methyltransferase
VNPDSTPSQSPPASPSNTPLPASSSGASAETPRPKRRERYSGRNPRKFSEKYKEHAPERYGDDVAKVLASGKTPAGMHRPILVREILEVLQLAPGAVVVDCTLGYGGHTRELLQAVVPGGRVIGLDVDPIEQPRTVERLRAAGFGPEVFVPVRRNFAGLPQVLAGQGIDGVDGLLADLGVSSMQLDDPARGFTFKEDGPLDLRLNPSKPPSAAEWLSRVSTPDLESALVENADEPNAALLARAILEAGTSQPIDRTGRLSLVIREALRTANRSGGRDAENACIRRVFQALRIAVNDEFGVLDSLLRALPFCLKPGGRAAILTFHSGEDRRVKKAFQEGLRSGLYGAIADEVIRPGAEELRANPRSAPAKLRWARRA